VATVSGEQVLANAFNEVHLVGREQRFSLLSEYYDGLLQILLSLLNPEVIASLKRHEDVAEIVSKLFLEHIQLSALRATYEEEKARHAAAAGKQQAENDPWLNDWAKQLRVTLRTITDERDRQGKTEKQLDARAQQLANPHLELLLRLLPFRFRLNANSNVGTKTESRNETDRIFALVAKLLSPAEVDALSKSTSQLQRLVEAKLRWDELSGQLDRVNVAINFFDGHIDREVALYELREQIDTILLQMTGLRPRFVALIGTLESLKREFGIMRFGSTRLEGTCWVLQLFLDFCNLVNAQLNRAHEEFCKHRTDADRMRTLAQIR